MDTVIRYLSPLAALMMRWPLWQRAGVSLAVVLLLVFLLSRLLPAILAGAVRLFYWLFYEWLFSITRGGGNVTRVLRRNARAEQCERLYNKLLPPGKKRRPHLWQLIVLYGLVMGLILLPSWAGGYAGRKHMPALCFAANAYHRVEAPILRQARRANPLDSADSYILRDVRTQNPYRDDIQFVCSRGLMMGNEDSFRPDDALTRGELAFVLYRFSGEPQTRYQADISDMYPGMCAYTAVQWCIEQGILSLLGDGGFASEQEVTCEQALVALFRYAENEGLPVSAHYDLSGLPGSENIHSWAIEACQWAAKGEFLPVASDGILHPRQPFSRSSTARLFYQFCIWTAGLDE